TRGNLLSYDGILRDITERKNVETKLLHTQKMGAVGRLAGGVAHDFNNILSAIVNYIFILRNCLKDNPSARTEIDHIYSLCMKASEITKGLLAFSRTHITDLVPVNLNEAVKNMARLLSKFIGEDIRLDMRLTEENLIIMADITKIEQIIINLATNSRDAMPDGGSITIETELLKLEKEFISHHGYGKPGTYAVLTFTDTGTGMDNETMQSIFEPFYTTKESGKGAGLGLSIIYGIVKQHNGHINVSSVPGKETSFKIYFPFVDSDVTEKNVMKPLDLAGNAETVLVAEDETEVRNSTKYILESFGYKVIEAVDGEDAVKKFIDNRDNIDLLFFDVIMPHMDGREAYEEIRKMNTDIKVVFASGYSAEIIEKKGIITDGFVLVSKPVSPDKLLTTIKEVLNN
ncbi:MAG: ATP-binding protein, partial [Nitrospirota bacterium]